MSNLNALGSNLIREIELADKYSSKNKINTLKTHKTASTLAFAYEKARNAVEYRDEHLIRLAAIERILKRRLFLNQSSSKIADSLIKELTWARYIESETIEGERVERFKNTIEKYKENLTQTDTNGYSNTLIGLCACEIDEILNFNPTNQILTNFVSTTLESIIDFDEEDKATKSIQIYIATERSFSKNSEILIKYKLLKVFLPKWDNSEKLFMTLGDIENHLDYKYKDLLRRKVSQMVPPFNLIKDFVTIYADKLSVVVKDEEEFKLKIKEVLEIKYSETKSKVVRASKRSIIYIFLTKMILALLIEIPFDILLGSVNYSVLAINILFPPSLMILFNANVRLPSENNSELMSEKAINYLFSDNLRHEQIIVNKSRGRIEKVFYFSFLITSVLIILGIVYLLSLLSFNFVNQIIFLFFLTVVSFFAFRVREISNDYLLQESENDSFLETLLDYIFLPIIKVGQWLSTQISKINILSFVFDFIIEAPLKSFLDILEQWLHFVRAKKAEFLG